MTRSTLPLPTRFRVAERGLGAVLVSGLIMLWWCVAQPARAQVPAEAPERAQEQAPLRLRIVGGLATVNQYTLHEEPFWTQQLALASGGRYSATIAPFDRAGIRAQEMLALVQTGVVPMGTLLLSVAAGSAPELAAPDLAGLNPDMATLRRTVAAFRPYLVATLRQRRGIEVLAIYTYPAQVTFCRQAFNGLQDLAGRRVRTSSITQSELFEALGSKPTPTTFAEIVPHVRSGNVDCVVTGAMAGHTLGLYEHTSHLHNMAVTWGLSAFVAHAASWNALPPDLKALLKRELPLLEQRIWDDAERETAAGAACNLGASSCTLARKGRMVDVEVTREDDALRREIFAATVLPRWLQRCGAACAAVWNTTIGPVVGIAAR